MRKASLVTAVFLPLSFAAIAAACGARSGLDTPPSPPAPPECVVDSDCDGSGDLCNPVVCELFSSEVDAGASVKKQPGGVCVAKTPVNCDDNNPCTIDTCDPSNAHCSYKPSTPDLDQDGHRVPLPGKVPGSPGSCGDDCDDTNPMAHPGAQEVCDGVDNDCNGVVDDNASYVPTTQDPVRVDVDLPQGDPGGLAWSGKSYASTFTATTSQGFEMYRSMLTQTGDIIPPGATRVTAVNADSGGGPIVWIGDRYGVVWEDRRDKDYEIYFTLLKEDGEKAIADTRLTFARRFSIKPSLAWTGNEFIVSWQDERGGSFDVFAQRVSVDGVPIGDNVDLTPLEGSDNKTPVVAAGLSGIGVAWSHGSTTSEVIEFQIVGPDLAPTAAMPAPIHLTDGSTSAVSPIVVYNKGKNGESGRYVVAWYDSTATPAAIYGAVLSEDGAVLVPTTALTNPGSFHSRYPALRALGDRMLLVYADDRDQNDGYELYTRLIDTNLVPLGPELRLTDAPRNSIDPEIAFGPSGDVGVLFSDWRINGEHHVFFTRLACVAGSH